jgi:leucyl-tRNA synthetase
VPDASLAVEASITMAVQVNGKLRATLTLPREVDAKRAEAAALADASVIKAIGAAAIKKVIVVPGKIINIVAA